MNNMRKLLVLTWLGMLTGCQTVSHVTKEPPKQASEALLTEAVVAAQPKSIPALPVPPPLPPLNLAQLGASEEERFDVAADQLSARAFFMGLVEGTTYNMIVHEGVSGEISLHLKDVTVAEVMQAVHEVYGYEFKRNGNLYQVVPAQLETKIYQVNYLDVLREGESQLSVSSGAVSTVGSGGGSNDSGSNDADNQNTATVGSSIKTRTSANFWGGLQKALTTIIGQKQGQQVVVTPQAGVVIVRGLPSDQQLVQEYLERSELILRRQVVIEAKILEVRLNNGFQAGIDWTAIGKDSGKVVVGKVGAAQIRNANAIGGVFSASFNLNDFTALIELLGTQGDVQVLSSPRVSTLNNQKAVIKVGSDEFFVTEIENTTTTGDTTTTSPSIELTPFFSGIALDVTPQISEQDEIVLHVHPSVSEVKDQQKLIKVGNDAFDIPLAYSTIRESDSVVRARNGQVIVIGGLMTSSSTDTQAKTPVLGDVPGLGSLFQQRRQSSSKSELVILLKPVVTESQGWQGELEQSLKSFQSLKLR